jgi:hypothetical protein
MGRLAPAGECQSGYPSSAQARPVSRRVVEAPIPGHFGRRLAPLGLFQDRADIDATEHHPIQLLVQSLSDGLISQVIAVLKEVQAHHQPSRLGLSAVWLVERPRRACDALSVDPLRQHQQFMRGVQPFWHQPALHGRLLMTSDGHVGLLRRQGHGVVGAHLISSARA